jgi:hypothetical protein
MFRRSDPRKRVLVKLPIERASLRLQGRVASLLGPPRISLHFSMACGDNSCQMKSLPKSIPGWSWLESSVRKN